MGLTAILWKWRGWRGDAYTAHHVNRMARTLAKHLRGARVVCITDNPRDIECETFPLWESPGAVPLREGYRTLAQLQTPRGPPPNCFTRLRLFDPTVNRWFGDKLLSVDLDSVILDDLWPLITDDPFKAARGAHSHVCGTLWQLRAGTHTEVWDTFDPERSPRQIAGTLCGDRFISGSDQAWMSIKMPDAPTWGQAEGVYWAKELERQRFRIPEGARIVYFAGKLKPWDAEVKLFAPQLHEAYFQ